MSHREGWCDSALRVCTCECTCVCTCVHLCVQTCGTSTEIVNTSQHFWPRMAFASQKRWRAPVTGQIGGGRRRTTITFTDFSKKGPGSTVISNPPLTFTTSPDSWKNHSIIIVTVVFPNVWQLWVVSVIGNAAACFCYSTRAEVTKTSRSVPQSTTARNRGFPVNS